MALILPNLTKYDIQFLIGDDLGSDHLPIEIYKFDQTDREVLESTLEAALSSGDIPGFHFLPDHPVAYMVNPKNRVGWVSGFFPRKPSK